MATQTTPTGVKAIMSWSEHARASEDADGRYQFALRELDKALVATIKYLAERKRGAPENLETQSDLTEKWMAASQAIAPFDGGASHAAMLKGSGWTDPIHWDTADREGIGISIEDMQEARKNLNAKRNEAAGHSAPKWFPVAGVIFAGITILFLMYLLIGPPIDPSKDRIFNAFLAFSFAASGGFLGGTAVARGKLPVGDLTPVQFSVAGGAGFFVVIYLVLNAT